MAGQSLGVGEYLQCSTGGRRKFGIQEDGNVVLTNFGHPTGPGVTNAHRIVMQKTDCNLVAYDKDGQAVWSSDTPSGCTADPDIDLFFGCELRLQEYGNLVIYGTIYRWAYSSARYVQPRVTYYGPIWSACSIGATDSKSYCFAGLKGRRQVNYC